jgi:hypothetical protein
MFITGTAVNRNAQCSNSLWQQRKLQQKGITLQLDWWEDCRNMIAQKSTHHIIPKEFSTSPPIAPNSQLTKEIPQTP